MLGPMALLQVLAVQAAPDERLRARIVLDLAALAGRPVLPPVLRRAVEGLARRLFDLQQRGGSMD